MIHLNEPKIDNEKVFEEVAIGKSKGKQSKMIEMEPKIFDRYNFYLQNKNNLSNIQPTNILGKEEINLLKNSYKKSKVICKVRTDLLNNIPENCKSLCPFCMISEPFTLDHYFPESMYPELIIFAPNLVPCCNKCNSLKGKLILKQSDNNITQRLFIHFYYDILPKSQYLKAGFTVDEMKIPHIEFKLEFECENEITQVISNHFDKLHLLKRYSEGSVGILSTECETIKDSIDEGHSLESIVDTLKIKANSLEKYYGINYWKTCIYRSLSENVEELKKLF